MLLWLENVVSQDGEVTTYAMLDDLWNVSAHVFWIFISETILNTQLKITCSSTGMRTHYTQGMFEPAAWRPGCQLTSLNLGRGRSVLRLPPSPESVTFLITSFISKEIQIKTKLSIIFHQTDWEKSISTLKIALHCLLISTVFDEKLVVTQITFTSM